MKRSGIVLAVAAAIAAAVTAFANRPVKHPESSGRWEPLERRPVER
ncbi:MAG: hypothetical protein KJP12_01765 [Acidimicrobiia bacterium]|nr:hypothetical protein [Acidimicrobiia bacterium]MBT8213920.1 hypothetical protein [Acidimicrobiia bacterium]NNF69055.1 hypothetical protein [Acidimicrobiia bacterium]